MSATQPGASRPAHGPLGRAWPAKSISRAKPLLFLAGLFPLARWIWLGVAGGLTANPIEFLTRSSGTWALVWLLITLGITPVRRMLGQPALVRVRRMCGLFAFFYAFLHFSAWAWWDRALDVAFMLQDVIDRPFITAGFAAFVLMTALALTSTQAAMRRMGRRWQQLHRAVYLIGMLAILHLWWHKAGKNDFFEPIVYGGVLLVLLGWRVAAYVMGRLRLQTGARR